MFGEFKAERPAPTGSSSIFMARLATAILQAAALYFLTDRVVPGSWQATMPWLFGPLLLISLYVPALVLFGLGQIRARPLILWALAATIIVAGLAYHDATRGRVLPFPGGEPFWPSFRLWLPLSIGIYVAHVLVVDAVIKRSLRPPYAQHFDTAWKQATQIVLAVVFVGVFWGVLELGAALFKLININFFARLIAHRWFAYPATTLALAVSIHATDVQPSLIRGARTVALVLFSWLLPLLSIILLGFLCSLPFVSLQPLWNTRFATASLLTAAGLLIFLINSCYQDGAAEQTHSRIKRLSATLGSIELVPLTGLAIWGLWLRVEQYGWTVERILAAAVILLVSCYAAGYASATVRSPRWMNRLEITNFATAYVYLALLLLLFSPIADPSRLMVADQVARLKSGAVKPEVFDFAALKYDGARWGDAALAELRTSEGPDAALIRDRVQRTLASTSRYAANQLKTPKPTVESLMGHVTVIPPDKALSPEFYDELLGSPPREGMPACLRLPAGKCIARFVKLRPGAVEEILFLDGNLGHVFELNETGRWRKTASFSNLAGCAFLREELERGEFQLQPHEMPDLVIGNQRLVLSSPQPPCTMGPTNRSAPLRP